MTESLFGMDGDIAPLPALAELADRYDAMMVVDEAHAGGVFGEEGRGLAHETGLADHPRIIRTGTLSKAIGCQGGFVTGSHAFVRWLLHSARGWIYSTAMSPYLAGAAAESVRITRAADDRRCRLFGLARRAREQISAAGWNVPEGQGPIVPVLVGEAQAVSAVGSRLAAQGLATGVIRPPTVPRGTARLRISLSAAHSDGHVDRLVAALGLADGSPND